MNDCNSPQHRCWQPPPPLIPTSPACSMTGEHWPCRQLSTFTASTPGTRQWSSPSSALPTITTPIALKGWEPTLPLQIILRLGGIHHEGILPFPHLAEPCPPHPDHCSYVTATFCCWGHSTQLHPWCAQHSGNGGIFFIIITGSSVYSNSKVSWDMNWWWALILVCNSIMPSLAKQPFSATDF